MSEFEYDIIIKFNSFRDLNTKDGWKILYGSKGKEKYDKSKENKCIIIGVTGNKNRGKSFLLNRITGYNIQSGYLHISKEINSNFAILKLKEVKSKNIIILITAGKENPLLEPTNDKKDDKKR